jgi:hemolysin activation/secretion protein
MEFALQKTDAEDVPHRGFKVKASVEGFPRMLDLPAAYGSAAAELNGYVPLIGGVHVAARAGGIQTFGEVPAFDLAAIGGRRTLRGYSSHRFAGDAAAYGGLELRVPLGNVALLVPGSLGVFALVDAGRVWENGESPGGWHSAYGGGLWFSVMERVLSAAWASGEKGTLHLWLGLPF